MNYHSNIDYRRNIPGELQQLPNWGVFKLIWQEDRQKYTKHPYNALTGQLASSTDSSTWCSFEDAVNVYESSEEYQGLAFFFQKPYIGIDLDGIGEDLDRYLEGDITDNIIYEFMSACRTYAEVSQSGKGVHLIGKIDDIPGARRRKGNVEMYNSGRFFAITGNRFGEFVDEVNWIEPRQMEHLYRKYLEPKIEYVTPSVGSTYITGNDLDIDSIIERACEASNGYMFRNLLLKGYEEAGYSSWSEADLAFANMLAFWTGRDFSKMDTIFRQSALMRPKYDERRGKTTYGASLLNKAIAETPNVFESKKVIEDDYQIYIRNQSEVQPKEAKKQKKIFYSWDDTGNAERFIDMFGEMVRFNSDTRQWMIYNGVNWETDKGGYIVHNLIDQSIEELKNEPIEAPEGMTDDEKDKLIDAKGKFVTKSRNHAGKNNLEGELKKYLVCSEDTFDKFDMVLNAQNGSVDLTSGELKESTPGDFHSKVSYSEFSNNFDCPIWLSFLDDVIPDKETQSYVQKCVGYSLTASTSEQCLFFLYGSGRNGKSVFIDTIKELVGTYAANIQADSLMVKRSGSSGHNEDIARLKGKRLVTSSEPNEGSRLDEGMIKQLTGEDVVSASYKGLHVFEYKPKYKLWIATNHKPYIRGTDEGIWRRIKIIPFLVTIPKEKIDKNLSSKLKAELPGILNWAIEGAIRWQKEGLGESAQIDQASKEYRREMDTMGTFLEETTEECSWEKVQASDLFKAYNRWALENNEPKMNATNFGRRMSKRLEKKQIKGRNYYTGIKLKYEGIKVAY